MIASLNEIGVTLRKAAAGAGASPGLALVMGRAGAWLCARGFDGVGAVLAAVGVAEAPLPIPDDGSDLELDPAPIAACGPMVCELVASGEIARAVLHNADSPLLALGFAGRTALNSGITLELTVSGHSPVVVGPTSMSPLDPAVFTAATAIGLRLGSADASLPEPTPFPHGVEVDDAAWARALELAHHTYVPATEESRLKGAGAGLTDND